MNRKLHHSLIAMSATTAVFGALLLAAGPAPSSVVVPPTLSISLPSMGSLPVSAALEMGGAVQAATQRRHLRHSRALLAMPYFSFAQGLRRNRS